MQRKPVGEKEKKGGFSLIEVLLSSALVVGITITVSTVLMQFAGHYATDMAAQHASSSADRVMAEFSVAMKRATSFSIYPDEATWLNTPNNNTASGNFIVITTNVGQTLAFAFSGGIISIINDPAGAHTALQCCSSATPTVNGTFVYQQDGVPAIAWTVSLPSEQMQFQTCSYPLYMQ